MIGRFFDTLEHDWFIIVFAIIVLAYYKGGVALAQVFGADAVNFTNALEARNAANTGFLSYPSGGMGMHRTAPLWITAGSTNQQDM